MAPRPDPQPALALAVKHLRKEQGLSQGELGHGAGIHPTWISHIESGRANPSWGTVTRIAAVLDVQLSELVLLAERFDEEAKK